MWRVAERRGPGNRRDVGREAGEMARLLFLDLVLQNLGFDLEVGELLP
jgi:hypothetical protein